MKRHDSEVISTTSSTSKGSERRKNRFSIRRIFYPGRYGRTKSRVSLNSSSSVQSEYSFVVGERDNADSRGASGTAVLPSFPAPTPHPEIPAVATTVSPPTLNASGEKERECPLCLMDHPVENFPEITTCYHRSCLNCLRTYLRIEITESRINIACPECAEKFHPNDIKEIIQDEVLMVKYEDFMVRRVLVSDPDTRWCPAPDCGYAVIAKECASCPKIKCERPGCNTFFCYHCKQFWHPNKTCDAARAERASDIRNGSITYSHDTESQKDFIKPCPRCSAFIMKMNDGSCNHMTCPVCGAEFCWLCMKEISDLHYLSPSGCTFWGKKPWSRKKKILWQLGTLVGAPVGITLLAGIAVPAMVIGIPVWVGRKVHSKYENSTRHRRNLAITGGVAASIIVSPIVAGLAVGIGIPILLGYVYGVVPISLCRSGGCGVRTTNSGGVRFEFEENETGISPTMYSGGDSQSVGTGHIPNPSIAPSIGEASVGMTNSIYSASGSHMDRVGINREESDRDSASNRAIAGASLNGSMCGSTYAAVIGLHTKLEVQAELESDVVTPGGKRSSFSSESANFSIGEKSIGEKSVIGDDASTRGLAGSLANYRLDSASVITSSEVQMDMSKVLQSQTKSGDHDSASSARDAGATTPRDGEITSLTSCLSQDDKKKTSSCPGSPLSGSGSLCDHEDGIKSHNLRCRRCRRTAKTAERQHTTEQMNVHFSDQVSLQSFQAEDAVLDLPMGKHDIDSLSEMCNEDSMDEESADRCGKRRMPARNNSDSVILVTEVEGTKPTLVYVKSIENETTACDKAREFKVKQRCSGYISPRDISMEMSSSASCYSSSSSVKYGDKTGFLKEDGCDRVISKSKSEEIYKNDSSAMDDGVNEKSKSEEIFNKPKDVEVGGSIKHVRRKSCELAIENGRISPLIVVNGN